MFQQLEPGNATMPMASVSLNAYVGERNRSNRRISGRWILGTLLVALILGSGFGAYSWYRSLKQSPLQVTATAMNDADEVYGTAALVVSRESLSAGHTLRIAATAVALTESQWASPPNRYVGGLYLLQPADTVFTQPAELVLTVTDVGRRGRELGEPRIGYWAVDRWETLDSTYDPDTHTVRASIQRVFPTGVAILPEETWRTQHAAVAGVRDTFTGIQDDDGDGLSDDRESFYGSDPESPDTDGDGYPDGTEVQAGYNPTGPGRLTE
jgi:hypothetical protein